MTLEVKLITEPKGSNPGGKCLLNLQGKEKQFYIKYCHGSRLPGQSALFHCHQPIYEEITAEMARLVGLHNPHTYVLMSGDLKFSGEQKYLQNIDVNKPCYFLSEIMAAPFKEDASRTRAIMEREKIYRDILSVSDIVGKKQNYYFYEGPDGGLLVYLDLGCNFVKAVNGFIFLQNRVAKGLYTRDFRREKKKLEKYHLIPNQPDANDLIPLTYLASLNPSLKLRCINSRTGKVELNPVGSLLKLEEIDEISNIWAQGILNDLKIIKGSELIVSN